MGEYRFMLKELLRVTQKRLWLITMVAIVLVGSAVGFSLTRTPVYEASIKILVGQDKPIDRPFDSDQGALEGEIMGLQQLTQTMVEAVGTRPVAEASIRRLGLQMSPDDLLENLNVEQVHSTQFVEVSYRDTDPERARLIADTIGAVATERISQISPSASIITAEVWEPAALPDDPVNPDPVQVGLVALVVGAMLGVALAFLLEHWRGSWRSPEEAEQISGVPNLGVIPKFEAVKGAEPTGQRGGY